MKKSGNTAVANVFRRLRMVDPFPGAASEPRVAADSASPPWAGIRGWSLEEPCAASQPRRLPPVGAAGETGHPA